MNAHLQQAAAALDFESSQFGCDMGVAETEWPGWASLAMCAAGLAIGFIGSMFHPGAWFQ